MPRLPSKSDLKRIDSMLGDITSKMDRLTSVSADWAGEMVSAARQAEDLADKLERSVDIQEDLSRARQRQVDIQNKLNQKLAQTDQLTEKESQQLERAREQSSRINAELVRQEKIHGRIVDQIGKQASGTRVLATLATKQLAAGFDKVGKGIIGLGLGALETGMSALWKGIYRVWELQERWTKAMGQFNLTIGATSSGLGEARQRAAKFEGTMHGLTGRFGEGIRMVGEFQTSFNRLLPGEEGDKWTMFGVKVARAMGLGASETGELFKTLMNVNRSFEDTLQTVDMVESVAGSAGVSVANFSKEISQSREFMVSFGKAGEKAFLTTAGWIRKMGVSLKSLERFMDITDTIDGAVKSTAKLNTIFGTTINSMELMLEQDPGKRFETVRKELQMQGRSVENMSRLERKVIAETTGLAVEEVDAMLKSGESLEEFRDRQAKEREKQASIEKRIQRGLLKTAETMFSFSQAADRITKAIGKLIKPFTNMLGLTKESDKKAKSFGQTMKFLTDKIVEFIEKIAGNEKFSAFMEKAAMTAKDLFVKIDEFVSGDEFVPWVEKIMKGFGDFFDIVVKVGKTVHSVLTSGPVKSAFSFVLDNIGSILKAWLGFKVAIGAFRIGGIIKQFAGLRGVIDGNIGRGKELIDKLAAPGTRGAGAAVGKAGGMGMVGKAGAVGAAGAAGFVVGKAIDSLVGELTGKKLSEHIGDLGGPSAKDREKEFQKVAAESQRKADTEKKVFMGNREITQAELQEIRARAELEKKQVDKQGKELGAIEKGGHKKLVADKKKQQDRMAELEKAHQQHIFSLRVRNELMATEEFKQFRDQAGRAGMKLDDVFQQFQRSAQRGEFGTGFGSRVKDIAEIDREIMKRARTDRRTAEGGIVSTPQVRSIAEEGPEAIIPLRTLAVPKARVPRRAAPDERRRPVNFAAPRGEGREKTRVVAGDVFLDSKLVGRHIVRELLTDVER